MAIGSGLQLPLSARFIDRCAQRVQKHLGGDRQMFEALGNRPAARSGTPVDLLLIEHVEDLRGDALDTIELRNQALELRVESDRFFGHDGRVSNGNTVPLRFCLTTVY